ncbi:MAG TPA: hypothetical protein VLH75_15505 [Longimicrobiales bacterium]|nr:hypothetical protein [Longimicrobiales bacterium]
MPAHRMHAVSRLPLLLPSLLLTACGGGGGGTAGMAPSAPRASDAEWNALATPRPEPLAGAARVSVGEIRILGTPSWGSPPVELGLGMSELVAAGLLRRRDVHFVERRRFAAAAEAERTGAARPEGAPPAGTSPGAQYVLSATWASVGLDSAFVDLRLADAQSGAVVASWRGATARDADPVSVARRVVAGTLSALESLGARPAWQDPEPGAAPAAYRPSGVGAAAVSSFFQGLAAEEGWSWERARMGYQAALSAGEPSFVEAAAALARTARLRSGAPLGAG